MASHEHTINDALAALLRETRHAWRSSDVVMSENTGMLKGSDCRPDILVIEPNASPVAIEAEISPATTVEADAVSRLGEQFRTTGRLILSSIAIRYPVRIPKKQGIQLRSALLKAKDLKMALYTGNSQSEYMRWPRSGWIQGSIADLSILTQSASIPPIIIEKAADVLVTGVSEAAALLKEISNSNPGAVHKISEELRQEDGEQTRRMATTILSNAFVFHESLAGGPGKLVSVKSIEKLRGTGNGITKSEVLTEWRKILGVNYWPIFDIARRILEYIPTDKCRLLIERLARTADRLFENRLMRSHDLTGAVFQRLIADRKFLAAYYTTPASAALLVSLVIGKEKPPSGGSWASGDDVKALRIADFACGTGTLLSTTYQRIGQLYELACGNAEALHPEIMANTLVGCDVLPAAAHLTASMLAGAHPTVKYKKSSILTVAYGKQPNGNIALGSLDLLDSQRTFDILDMNAKAAESMGEAEKETWSSLPHASFDVVIMNPPFTRATGHEGEKIGIPNPMFAAFRSSDEEQRLMSKAIKRLTHGTSAHGNAGEASIFLVLADRKLKTNGMLALVMPLSLISGDAWEESRVLIAKNYKDIVIISIAGIDGSEISFSADTGIGECLVIGRKAKTGKNRAVFVVLDERPKFQLLGASIANQIHTLTTGKNLRCLDDGPYGGSSLHFGDDTIGQAIEAPLPESGGWNLSRIADFALAQAAYQLIKKKRVWLPGMDISNIFKIPITTVAAIGKIGPYHADINGLTSTGGIRGPFDISAVRPHSAPTYPVIWAHDAKKQQSMSFDGESEALSRKGATPSEKAIIDDKVASIWATASHCHFNRDFRFNSQSTGMQYTPRRTIGGRAWISIRLSSVKQEKALVLWANTSLGLLLHWYHSNRQQSGRGSVGVSVLETLSILDVSKLKPKQLDEAAKLFDEMSDQDLLPLHEIDIDASRRKLDNEFAVKVLGLSTPFFNSGGPLELLRMKLAKEPSIRGYKRSVPKTESSAAR